MNWTARQEGLVAKFGAEPKVPLTNLGLFENRAFSAFQEALFPKEALFRSFTSSQ